MSGVSIKNLTRQHLKVGASVAFSDITASVLPEWDISLAFVSATKALELNKKLRKKNYIPNVLSYVVGEKSCEIIICLSEVKRQAPSFRLPTSDFCLLLFIHAVLHIKGWAHGDKMDKCERKLLARYEKTHSNRNRYRHVPGKNGRR